LRQDLDENRELYGKELTNRQILTSDMKPPAAAQPLIAALNRFSPSPSEGTRAREKK
jgi:lipid-binding SYLF domain-containing protein